MFYFYMHPHNHIGFRDFRFLFLLTMILKCTVVFDFNEKLLYLGVPCLWIYAHFSDYISKHHCDEF